MDQGWDTHVILTAPEAEGLGSAQARLDGDTLFFSGHFPDHPVVPAIALLDMVTRTVALASQARGQTRTVMGFRRVRFRHAVETVGRFEVRLGPGPARSPEAMTFEVRFDGERACDGLVLAPTGFP